MKRDLHICIGASKQWVGCVLLLVFLNLIAAECLHRHQRFDNPQAASIGYGTAAINKLQLSCKFCDYLHHQHHSLPLAGNAFIIPLVKVVCASKILSGQFVYVFNDLLLFSGNSPPTL
jgi:hypothetical protein